jgi:hypothetical protein
MRGVFAAVLGLAALGLSLGLSSCGSSEEPPSDVDLFREYARSTEVINDKFPSEGVSGEDRLANFASQGPPEAIQSQLLSATECADDCNPGGATRAAAKDFGGTLFERSLLVKHDDGALELVSLYVAQKSEQDALLIDATGQTYGDLEDFRANNDVLTSEDLMLAPQKITAVPGEGEIVTVYGHTTTNWLPWVLGGAGLVVVLGAGLAVRRRAVTRREVTESG